MLYGTHHISWSIDNIMIRGLAKSDQITQVLVNLDYSKTLYYLLTLAFATSCIRTGPSYSCRSLEQSRATCNTALR